ncbi:unnamed protein product [Leptosia nina]|uniref:UDP-glucuronosyltransferase n=1 Tax=Leptosia nina TaxID=320188 RepID=A0AAV1K4W0_9NEOP
MKCLLLLCVLVCSAVGYKILCFHPIPSKSHFHLVTGIVHPLVKAGHEVTFVTVFPEAVKDKSKNLRVVDLSHHKKFLEYIDMSDPKVTMTDVQMLSYNLSVSLVQTPAVQDMMVNEQFDAIVTEWFFTEIEAGYAAVQGVPWILLSGNVYHSQVEQIVDAVRSLPILPGIHSRNQLPLTFWQRVQNTLFYCLMSFDEWRSYSVFKAEYEKHFGAIAAARGVPLPPFEDVHRNVSIVLSDSHPSFSPAISKPPNVIEIAGYHIDANIPDLPKDLQDILDSSTHGVIYFSMGSVLKATALKEKTRKELIEVFGSLKQTVLWKFDETFENLPKNIHVRSWMPQSSILAHPNVKVFITHGGLLSTLESLQYGVPLLAIPVFADQPHNAARSVQTGQAVQVQYSPDMAPKVKEALFELLRNDSYSKKAKYLSKLFKNRLNKPSELITHYIELAIETKGALHLRSIVKYYKWYEYLMLDQALLLIVVLYIVYSVLRRAINVLTKEEPKKSSKKKRD